MNPRVIVRIMGLATTATLALSASAASAATDALAAGFLQPPPQAYPAGSASSSASPEALKALLARQKLLGVNQARIGSFPPGYMTPAWKASLSATVAAIGSAGFTTGFNTSPGFSQTGDFFVQPQEAMKKLVWSTTAVKGGEAYSGRLASPPANSGPFQNIPYSNETPWTMAVKKVFYRDVMVLAYPLSEPAPIAAATATSSSGPVDAARLLLVDPDNPVRVGGAGGSAWLQLDYPAPQTIRTAVLATPEMRIDGSMFADLQALGADGRYRHVVTLDMRDISHVTRSFAPVQAKSFRLVFARHPSTYEPMIPLAGTDTARGGNDQPFGVKGTADTFPLAGFSLLADGRTDEFERKAGFFTFVSDYYALATPPAAANVVTHKGQVIDITDRMRPDGTLDWTPPPGRWEIVRFGYSLTGKNNHPAAPDATGLEVDKLSAVHMTHYLERYLDGILPAGPERRFVRSIFSDSIESGPQNWTDDMLAEFRRRRGYDPLPYLPALTGVVVDSVDATDRFLWDYRQTVADLIHENTYGKITEVAHSRGLQTQVEALEQARHQLGDDFEMRRYADMPVGAMWSGGGRVDYLKDFPNQVADERGAASVAHVYGRTLVGAESGTDLSHPFAFSPRNLKPMVDLEFALGINWMTRGAPSPQETWAAYGGDWVQYLARTSFMLQEGRPFADVAYFYGQDAPLVTLRERLRDTPKANSFDFINAQALTNLVSVKDRRLTTPSGMAYRVLQLGGSSDMMTLPMLRRLETLVRAGLVVVGKAPLASPSLADDPAEFARLKTRVWGADGHGGKLGLGRVYGTGSVDQALATEHVGPDIAAGGAAVGDDLVFQHRRVPDGDVYYVMNRKEAGGPVELSFRQTGKAPELWRADTGERTPLTYHIKNGRTIVPVDFRPNDAVFVVFRAAGSAAGRTVAAHPSRVIAKLNDAWRVSFPADRGGPAQPVDLDVGSWSEKPDPGIRYFSGTATYSRTIDMPPGEAAQGKTVLSLGDVRDIAEVSVNGAPVGVRWTAPYSFDVSSALRPGANRIEIKVTNLWINRLIGDKQPGARPIAAGFGVGAGGVQYRPDAPLRPSGLIGPVALMREP